MLNHIKYGLNESQNLENASKKFHFMSTLQEALNYYSMSGESVADRKNL